MHNINPQNYRGQDALQIATEHDQTDCITHISTKQGKPHAVVPELVGSHEEEENLYKWVRTMVIVYSLEI